MAETKDTETGKERKPFAEFLDEHRRGATHAELSQALADVVAGVAETGKKGEIKLKINVKPSGDGMVIIEDEIDFKVPEPDRSASMFFYDEDGNVSRFDPNQQRLDLRGVEDGDKAKDDQVSDNATNPPQPAEFNQQVRELSESEASHIIDVAVASAKPNPIDPTQIHSLVLPRGASAQIVDIEGKGATPRRKRGELRFWDAESLSIYVITHKGPGTTLLLDDRQPQLVAVLNGDSADAPGWGDHTAALGFRPTEAWNRWLKLNEQLIDQEDFAEHIERNLVDITSPSGADMLELAQTFQATNESEFSSQKRLANGQRQFTYTENINGKGGQSGQIEVPEKITLQIAPFEGGEEYTVTARFRFRLTAGHLRMGYVLDNPQDIERTAVAEVAKQVGSLTSLQVLYGAVYKRPEPAR